MSFGPRQKRNESGAAAECDLIRWVDESDARPVEFSRSVIRQILTYAEDGFRKLSRGGIEVGGVLFGRRTPAGLEIHAWREIECKHTRGPAFLLSNSDRQTLAKLLESAETDTALQVLEPIGWFVSHTRQGLGLTDEDRDLFQQFFDGPNHIAVVLRPQKGKPMEGALFARGDNGQLPAEPLLRTFDSREFPAVALPAIDGGEPANMAMTRPPTPLHAGSEVKKQQKVASPSFWRRIPGWAYACVGVLACGVLVLAIPPMRRVAGPEGAEGLRLRLQDSQGQLRIEWDRESATMKNAERATLYITDGRPLAPIELDRDTAQKGFLTYGRLGEDISVRMVVNRKEEQPFQELARFVGAPIPKEEPKELKETRQKRDQLLDEIRKLRQQLAQEAERSQSLETVVSRIEKQIERETAAANH